MRRFLTVVAVSLLAAGCAFPASRGRIVIVTMGGVPLDHVTSPGLPSISRLISKGAIAVMNTRPASGRIAAGGAMVGGYSMEGSCATIGAGTRAAVTIDARRACNASGKVEGRPARNLYTSLYARSPGPAEVLHLGMNRLFFINKDAKYAIEPGELGSALHRAGLKTAAIGNSDTPSDPRREAALIAADSNGIIDYGNVGAQLNLRDPDAPYGMRANARAILAEFRRVLPKADFIVVDVGDTARAASYSRHCLETQGDNLRRRALQDADRIVGGILRSLDLSSDWLMVVSTNPSWREVDNFDFLPPVMAVGKGIKRGLLSSGSTRRPGIIMNTDISASALEFFGIKPPFSFVGRPIVICKGSLGDLVKTNERIVRQIERQPAMEGLAMFLLAYVIVLSAFVLWRPQVLGGLGLWAALVPTTLILAASWLPAIADPGLAGAVAAMAGLTLAIVAMTWVVLRSPGRAFGWVCVVMTLTVLVDLARGGVLLRDSIMSYTPVEGARFYGIGNYQMGSAIGAAMLAAGFLASALSRARIPRLPVLTVMLAALVAGIGLPSCGANAGGGASAIAAAAFGLFVWQRRTISRKHVVLTVIIVPVALGLILLFDSVRSSETQSHVARAAYLIRKGGVGEIWTVIERKAGVNLALLRNSTWSKLLIASVVAVIAALRAKHLNVLSQLKTDRDVYTGVRAAAVGALAALLLNDSGVVAAATAFVYVWTAVVLTALAAPKKKGQGI